MLLLTRDPDDPKGEQGTRRVLVHAKCNVGAYTPSLIYEITPESLPNGIETSHMVRIGESPHGARDLLEMTHKRSRDTSKLDEARNLLQEELGDRDWHPVGPIKAKAMGLIISEATLDRAKRDLRVEHRVVKGFPPTHEWRIAPTPPGRLLELFPIREDQQDDVVHESGPDGIGDPS